ncbi:MAG: hypothetical protein WA755_16690 [Candidatus Acidiferrales bacterium]
MEGNKPLQAKLRSFGESAVFWGGIGVVVGAIACVVSSGKMLILGAIVVCVALIKGNFFENQRWYSKLSGNLVLCLLLGAVLFVVWKIIPKPKEFPTAQEIAREVRKQEEGTAPINVGMSSEPEVEIKPQQHPQPQRKPQPQKPNPPAELNPTPKRGNPRPPSSLFTVVRSEKYSTRVDAPYETEFVVQTPTVFSALNMTMTCDKPLVDFKIHFPSGGVQMTVRWGIVREHPNVLFYSYGFASPPFGPDNPLIVDVWSMEPINCEPPATY